MEPIYCATLSLHCDYIRRVLRMPESRYPRIVLLETISKNLNWAEELERLADRVECDLAFETGNLRLFDSQLEGVIRAWRNLHRKKMMTRALASSNVLYRELDYT